MFAKFVERLAKAQEGDGTVLDHSTILFGSNMSNSDKHNNDPLPAAILGHAHGRIKGGQHVKYPQDSRFADLLRDAVRSQQHPGGEARRQRRHLLGGLRACPNTRQSTQSPHIYARTEDTSKTGILGARWPRWLPQSVASARPEPVAGRGRGGLGRSDLDRDSRRDGACRT